MSHINYEIGQRIMFVNPSEKEKSLLMFVKEDNDNRVLVQTYWSEGSFTKWVLNTYMKSDIEAYSDNGISSINDL